MQAAKYPTHQLSESATPPVSRHEQGDNAAQELPLLAPPPLSKKYRGGECRSLALNSHIIRRVYLSVVVHMI